MSTTLNIQGKEYLPPSVAGKRFGYTAAYMLMLAKDGKIEGTKVGSRWFVNPDSIEEFFKHADTIKKVRSKSRWINLDLCGASGGGKRDC